MTGYSNQKKTAEVKEFNSTDELLALTQCPAWRTRMSFRIIHPLDEFPFTTNII
jgi:hypothetical protein